MRKLRKHSSPFELDPFLIKEWHPTLNAGLTPQDVKIIHPKKLWWICSGGHEWKATIKSRMKGNGCPECEKAPVKIESDNFDHKSAQERTDKKERIFFETDYSTPDMVKDHRKSRRYRCNATAIIEIQSSGHLFYAQIKNISHSGMYFETEAALSKGTEIIIKLDRPFASFNQNSYSSIVRWSKGLDDENESISSFGHGVNFV